jgi:hypothetical protein
MVGRDLHERHPRGVAEAAIGRVDEAAELRVRKCAAQERAHNAEGRLLEGQARKRRDLARGHHRDRLGHVKAAVGASPVIMARLKSRAGAKPRVET